MKALVKEGPGQGLSMREVPMPRVGGNDLLIRVEKAAICGTDLHIWNWDEWSQRTIRPPLVTGHEFVGRIVDMGANVSGYEVGERVSGEGHIVCGVCRSCRAGRRHLCTATVGIGVNRDGCFAEYLSLPASNAWHVHARIPSEIACFLDPLGNATHSALSFDLVGEDVLITGAGPIGIMAAAICRHCGAQRIVITDVNDFRLGLASRMGATLAVNIGRTSIEEARRKLGIIGFDIGLEMSGNGGAFESMLENMYHGGRIALLGILPNSTGIRWDQVIFKGLQIKGIYGREIFETWYKMQTMLQSGLDVLPVLTHRFPFDRFEEGFAAMRSGDCGKVILEIGEETAIEETKAEARA
jgi:threonine 3-dehydrogenase